MSSADIHPEDLFDRLAEGTLSELEGERLRVHLDQCEVCRFELTVRGDFRADAPRAEASPGAGATNEAPHQPPQAPARSRRRPARRAFVWIGAAAAFLMATGALASVLSGAAPWRFFGENEEAPAPGASAGTAARPGRASPRPAPVNADPTEATAPSASASPEVASNTPIVAAREAPSRSAAVPPRSSAPEPATPAALFKAANRARGSGEVTQAVKLYRQLQRDYPASSEAALSQLTLATLLLHTGDSRAALSGFDAYLARASRPLEAEALVGRALALRALGRSEAEVAAWQVIVRRYPGSSYARRATERLAAAGRR